MHRFIRILHRQRRVAPMQHAVRHASHSSRSTREGWPTAANLDSVQSDSPLHFYQTKILHEYVNMPVNASTLKQYIFFGRHMTDERLIKAANFVRTELAVRLAHIIRDFQRVPFYVGTNPHIEFIYRLYWGAFEKLRKHPPIQTLQDNDRFCELLRGLLDDGQLVVPRMALGVSECASYCDGSHDLDRFVNRMLRSRISRRVLAEQHIALTDAFEQGWDVMGEGDGYVGIIFVRCSVKDVTKRAIELVQQHAKTVYHDTYCKNATGWQPPEIHIDLQQDRTGNTQQPGDDIVFAYVPEQLEFILFELLSNAMRFTILHHNGINGHNDSSNSNSNSNSSNSSSNTSYPPIRLTVCANRTEVFFRVSDQGGGIPHERYAHLWSYQDRAPKGEFRHFAQIHKVFTNMNDRADQAAHLGRLHLGMGLAMSRTYAEYWGGELQVMTMEGYGTDAYVRIPRLGTQVENLSFELDPLNQAQTEDGKDNASQRHTLPHTQHSIPLPLDGEGWTKSNMVRE